MTPIEQRGAALLLIHELGGHWWVSHTGEASVLYVEIPGYSERETYPIRAKLVDLGLADTTTAEEQ